MAATRTGTPSIIKLVRRICRIKNLYGAQNLEAKTTSDLAAAVDALVIACAAFEALDDFPGQVDATGPLFSGDPDEMPSDPE